MPVIPTLIGCILDLIEQPNHRTLSYVILRVSRLVSFETTNAGEAATDSTSAAMATFLKGRAFIQGKENDPGAAHG